MYFTTDDAEPASAKVSWVVYCLAGRVYGQGLHSTERWSACWSSIYGWSLHEWSIHPTGGSRRDYEEDRWCHGGWHTAFAGSRTRREVSGVRAAAAAHCPIGADVHCSVYRDW